MPFPDQVNSSGHASNPLPDQVNSGWHSVLGGSNRYDDGSAEYQSAFAGTETEEDTTMEDAFNKRKADDMGGDVKKEARRKNHGSSLSEAATNVNHGDHGDHGESEEEVSF